MTKLSSILGLILLYASTGFSQTPCQNHPLFSMLPEHKVSGCEEKEFDVLEVEYRDRDGNWVKIQHSGYFLKTYYEFLGEWEKRPSNPMIFQNYIQAVTSKGGTLINESKGQALLHLKSAGESWWIHIQSDQSGTYSLTGVREESLTQSIVLKAEDIDRELKASGKAAFYGIFFDTDQASIKPESEETLAEMAKYLLANPQLQVYIVGHTDNTGSLDHNQELSERRAQAVVQTLTTTYRVPAAQLSAYGVASLSPVSTNSSEEGKGKNRRVEMVLK